MSANPWSLNDWFHLSRTQYAKLVRDNTVLTAALHTLDESDQLPDYERSVISATFATMETDVI